MTDEYRPNIEDDDEQAPDIEANDDIEEGDDPNLDIAVNDEQWEEVEGEGEIDPAEVERVVKSVGELMENVESDTVYEILHSAYENISDLVEWEEEDDTDKSGQAEAA